MTVHDCMGMTGDRVLMRFEAAWSAKKETRRCGSVDRNIDGRRGRVMRWKPGRMVALTGDRNEYANDNVLDRAVLRARDERNLEAM